MYRCYATNPLGSDETSCLLHVDGIEKNVRSVTYDRFVCSVEVRRTRRAHSVRPGDGDTSRSVSRARSPSPLTSSRRDSSWRDKLGAGERPAARDTLDVERPSRMFVIQSNPILFISLFRT